MSPLILDLHQRRNDSASSSVTSDWEPNIPRRAEMVGISPAQSPLKYRRTSNDPTQPYAAVPASAPAASRTPDLHPLAEEVELEGQPSLHTTLEVKPGSRQSWAIATGDGLQSQAAGTGSTPPLPRKFLPEIKVPSFDFSKYEARLTKIPAPPNDQPSIIPPQSLIGSSSQAFKVVPLSYVPSSSAPSSTGKKTTGAKGNGSGPLHLQPSQPSEKNLAPLVAPPMVKSSKIGFQLPDPKVARGHLPPLLDASPSPLTNHVKSKDRSIKPVSGRKVVDSARKSQGKKGLSFGATTRSYQPNYLAKIG